MTDYTMKVKEVCDALGSINVMVDEDEMVQICLGGLAQRYMPIWMTICTWGSRCRSSTCNQCFWSKRTTECVKEPCGCCAHRWIGSTGVKDEVHRLTIMAADKSRVKGIINIPTTVPDPPLASRVKEAPKTGKQRSRRKPSIVARRATEKASVERRMLIWKNLNLAKANMEIDNDCTTSKGQKDPKPKRGQPL